MPHESSVVGWVELLRNPSCLGVGNILMGFGLGPRELGLCSMETEGLFSNRDD